LRHTLTLVSTPGLLSFTDRFKLFTGKFLVNNYLQALDILKGQSALKKTMEDLGVADTGVFAVWLEEEREYLKGLLKEPIRETVEMEYYQKLVNLHASE
jgi:hypothetical protein